MRWRFCGKGAVFIAILVGGMVLACLQAASGQQPESRDGDLKASLDAVGLKAADSPSAAAMSPGDLSHSFDMGVFSGRDEQAVLAVRSRLTEMATRKAAAIGRAFRLKGVQRDKLRLAGELDIKRLWDRIDSARQAYIEARRFGQNDVNGGEDPEMGALRYQLRFGPFGEDSLLEKARRRMLSAESGKAWEVHRERVARLEGKNHA